MEKEKIKVGILQMSSIIGDVEGNIEKVKSFVKEHLDNDTDVLVLPEVWTVGWSCSHFRESAQNLMSGSVYECLSDIAKEYEVNIIGGSFITKSGDGYYNTCPVFNSDGNLIASYSKMHLYSYYGCDEGKYITEGKSPVMVDLCGVNFGLTICYDIRFPEIYRAYRKCGADIIVNAAAWGANKKIPWDTMVTSRAVENQVYFVALTQTGTLRSGEQNLGHSMIIDYQGNVINEINKIEGGFYADINLKSMYEFRNKCTILKDIRESYEVEIK
jgi:predicted amidohydrolase